MCKPRPRNRKGFFSSPTLSYHDSGSSPVTRGHPDHLLTWAWACLSRCLRCPTRFKPEEEQEMSFAQNKCIKKWGQHVCVCVWAPGPLCRVQDAALYQEAEILHLVLSGISELCTKHRSLPLSYLLQFGHLQPYLPFFPGTMTRGIILKSWGWDNGFLDKTPKAQQKKEIDKLDFIKINKMPLREWKDNP